MWTCEIALPIIRQIAPIAKQHGFDLALYGSVLTNGQGDDLDLYFIEAEVNTKTVHARDFLDVIATTLDTKCGPLRSGHAFIFFKDGNRIDAHFLRYTHFE